MDWNNHVYINLDKRGDHNTKTIKQLMKLGITKPNRFSAIEHQHGIIGCALSHIKVIENAIGKELPYICVFEDDIDIIEAHTLKSKVNHLIDADFDVLMLAGNNFGGTTISEDLHKVERCYTTGAYIIKQHYYETWLKKLKQGVLLLVQSCDRVYSLDSFNHILQRQDKWYLLTPICIIQKSGYSNIENRKVDYSDLMLDYQK